MEIWPTWVDRHRLLVGRNKDGVMDAAIERNLVRLLKPEPGVVNGERYATPTLCDILEGCEDIDLLASSIKRYLLRLKGTKGTTAFRCYDRKKHSKKEAAERWYWDAGIIPSPFDSRGDGCGFRYYSEPQSTCSSASRFLPCFCAKTTCSRNK